MTKKKIEIFAYSSAILLLIVGLAKIFNSFGAPRVLIVQDPIFKIPFHTLFAGVGVVEVVVAAVCLSNKPIFLKVCLIAWLSTAFLLYRLGLVWVDYTKPCGCLGSLTGALHIPPQTADGIMKVVLGYLLIGSYASLFWLRRQQNPQSSVVK